MSVSRPLRRVAGGAGGALAAGVAIALIALGAVLIASGHAAPARARRLTAAAADGAATAAPACGGRVRLHLSNRFGVLAAGDTGAMAAAVDLALRRRPRCTPVRAIPMRAAGSAHIVSRRLTVGHSVDGRPIYAWSFGPDRARRKVLVVGCIHGNECAAFAILAALRHTAVPAGVQLWLVPEFNPDGSAADTRQNAHGVDLNRNFPYRWAAISDPVYYSGPHPESEPETRAAMAFIGRIRPAVTIWYHQHMDLTDESGGDFGLIRRYAEISGLRATCLTFLSGEATRWSNHTFPRTTAFVVELPAGPVPSTAIARHVRAVRALELGQRTGSATRCDSVTQAA